MPKVDCSELAKTLTEFAMHVAVRDNAQNADDVVRGVQKDFPNIRREDLVDAIVEATSNRQREVDDITSILNTIKREFRGDDQLNNQIADLTTTYESGEIPARAKRVDKATTATKQLRAVRDNLKKKIQQSEPVQRQRLEKQIAILDARLESGDILPKTREVPPTSKALERLEFERDELQRAIRRKLNDLKPQNPFEKFIAEPANFARSIMTAFDLSIVFRQGGFFSIGRPIESIGAFKAMNRALFSREAMFKIHKELEARPNRPLSKRGGLFIAPIDGTYKMTERDELFQNKWAQFIPGVAASERAYLTGANVQRSDIFDILAATLTKDGEVTLQESKDLSNFINIVSGRGNLGALERAAVALNVGLFAPRYVASRFQLLLGMPLWQAKSARARKLIAKEYARYLTGMAVIYGSVAFLASVVNDDDEEDNISIEDDPRSSDFGKIRIGDTRLDPLSGLSQTIVVLSRLIGGKTKSSTSGKITPLRGKEMPIWSSGTAGVAGRFLRTKFSPLATFVFDPIVGENVIGEPVTLKSSFTESFTPLAMGEVFDVMKAQGLPRGTILSILAVLGMGVQTYGSRMNALSLPELRKELNKNIYKRRFKFQKRIRRDDGTFFTTGPIRFFPKGAAHQGKEDKVKAIRKAIARKKTEVAKKK